MPKYLVEASYTAEGIIGLKSQGGSARVSATKALIEELGGTLECSTSPSGIPRFHHCGLARQHNGRRSADGRQRQWSDYFAHCCASHSERDRRGSKAGRFVSPAHGLVRKAKVPSTLSRTFLTSQALLLVRRSERIPSPAFGGTRATYAFLLRTDNTVAPSKAAAVTTRRSDSRHCSPQYRSAGW